MHNVSDIFSLWPTDADMGRDIGVSYPAVAAWKRRGSIPASYWRDLVAAARRRGYTHVTADILAELHAANAREQSDTPGSLARDRQTISALPPGGDDGHFSRFKHLRRPRFASADEIVDHIRALREEWDRR